MSLVRMKVTLADLGARRPDAAGSERSGEAQDGEQGGGERTSSDDPVAGGLL